MASPPNKVCAAGGSAPNQAWPGAAVSLRLRLPLSRPAPVLGGDSRAVLREAGFSDEDIARMADNGSTLLG